MDPDFAAFNALKQAQVETLAAKDHQPVPPIVRRYFAAASRGDFITASNCFEQSRDLTGAPRAPHSWLGRFLERVLPQENEDHEELHLLRHPLVESFGTWELYRSWNPKFLKLFGQGIIASIPTNSIYFGGTDPGRFLVTLMSEAQLAGRPFFTVTQNALADGSYLEYLSNYYGGKIYLPTSEDQQRCFQEYIKDAQRRIVHDRENPTEPRQVRPGEDIQFDTASGKVNVSGQVAVMSVNALLARIIVEKNPDREIYLEESFPLEWMYPHLEPHQFILRVHHDPLKTIPEATLRADREFWTRHLTEWLGPWLNPGTPLSEVTGFTRRVYLQHDLTGFKGDADFVKDSEARKAFSKLRSAIAGVYAWRATNTENASERERMRTEADFAFRQAFAICPDSPETVFRYIHLLLSQGRRDDAGGLAEISQKLDPDNVQFRELKKRIQSESRP